MKLVKLAFYATSAFLLAVAISGAYFYEPLSRPVLPTWLPTDFLTRSTTETQWGDLSGFGLVIDCAVNHTKSAPVINYGRDTITQRQFEDIALNILHVGRTILAGNSGSTIRLEGQRLVYLGSRPSEGIPEGEWDPSRVRGAADDLMAKLEPYWAFETDAKMRADEMGPSSETVSQEGRKVVEYAVHYRWSVNGIDIERTNCYASMGTDYRVRYLIYGKPSVKVVGEQSVTVTPEQAIRTFVSGRGINDVFDLGLLMVIWPNPSQGTLTIDDIRLVYYPLVSQDGEVAEVLVYKISFTAEYESRFEGRRTVSSVVYEYAN